MANAPQSLPPTPTPGPRQLLPGAKAVRWLSPSQLARTGLEVAQGVVFARYADKREVEASAPAHAYDLSKSLSGRDAWIDFAADVGDGFNATYAVACSIAGAGNVSFDQSSITDPADAADYQSVRAPGNLLVFGGDEVYPAASAERYINRLNRVYQEAAGEPDVAPVVAVAGNHDWYDGLVSFRRNFCESWTNEQSTPPHFFRDLPEIDDRDKVGGWGAIQSRSYFAVKLTPSWWLWGTDIQLDAPIDAEQTSYFRRAAQLLHDDDYLILATARPSWIDRDDLDNGADLSNKENLVWFIDRVLGPSGTIPDRRAQLRLLVSGDEHHYSRYHLDSPGEIDPQELVTCGGGGAFLSSTHHLRDQVSLNSAVPQPPDASVSSYSRATCYPAVARSVDLRKGFWRIPYRNSLLWLFVGIIYLLLLEAVAFAKCFPNVPDLTAVDWRLFSASAFAGYLPLLGFVIVLLLVLVAFANHGHNPNNLPMDFVVGGLHTATHLGVMYGVAAVIGAVFGGFADDGGWARLSINVLLIVLIATFIGVLGTNVFALYLFVANLAGYHNTELFSGMRIEDYKCHLRLHVTDSGLRGHAIAIDTVPKEWLDDGSGRRKPADGSTIAARHLDSFWIPTARGTTG
jgi:Calcineurin-like phosphoesterase